MDKWNEIRTAYKLAKYRTLSATAADMGVHRSTVMRHIDALESELGVVLFQRNDKGYVPTDAGLEVMRLGEVTENQFSQLATNIMSKEQALKGTITITTLSDIANMLMPYIREYQRCYPDMRIDFIGDMRNYSLEYGEADIAIRTGEKPTTPDNIVFPITDVELVLCVHKDYIKQMGMPTEKELVQHRFIAMKERPSHLRWNEWIHSNIPKEKIVFLCSSLQVAVQALEAGSGICTMPKRMVESDPNLVEIPTKLQWSVSIWALVHRDMFNLAKIRSFIDILRNAKEIPIHF